MDKRAIIIFGATSEIGRSLLTKLPKDYEIVFAFGRDENKIFPMLISKNLIFEKFPPKITEQYLTEKFEYILSKYSDVSFIYLIGKNYPKPITKISYKEIDDLIFTNLRLFMLSVQKLLGVINSSSFNTPCKIIVISSIAGLEGFNNSSIYSATKYALIGFIKSLEIEYKNSPIDFYAVCPGLVKSKSIIRNIEYQSNYTNESKMSIIRRLLQSNPLCSWNTIDDISYKILRILKGEIKTNIILIK